MCFVYRTAAYVAANVTFFRDKGTFYSSFIYILNIFLNPRGYSSLLSAPLVGVTIGQHRPTLLLHSHPLTAPLFTLLQTRRLARAVCVIIIITSCSGTRSL